MDTILESLGLGSLVEKFAENKVNPSDVLTLTDEEFGVLGVHRIGDRARLRSKCRESVQGNLCASPIVQRIRQMQSGRKRKKAAAVETPNSTYRVYVGWKHKIDEKFVLVRLAKGGGKQILDIKDSARLENVREHLTDVYLPQGKNTIANINLESVTANIATFAGNLLPETLKNGQSFTLGGYVRELSTHPIRLYLQTAGLEHDIELQSATTEEEILHHECGSSTDSESLPDLDFTTRPSFPTESGTPTITFRQSATLSSASTSAFHVSLLNEPSTSQAITGSGHDIQELAARQSLHECATVSEDVTIQDILSRWISATTTDTSTTIIINRHDLYASTLREVRRSKFSYTSPVKVVFSGEIGEDLGGPKREFFRELLKELINRCFEGKTNRMCFRHDVSLLESGQFTQAGKFVAWSILNDGPGIPVMDEGIYKLTMGLPVVLTEEAIETIADEDVKSAMTKINECSLLADLESDDKMIDFLSDAGINTMISRMVKQDLISNLLRHFLYYRTYAEMKQFVDGLNAVGEFGDKVIKDYPLKAMGLFVNKHQAFDFESFRDLFVINYSEPHANNRKLEEDSIYCFNIFLRDTADGDTRITMKDLLQFWTGADEIPPLGFHKKLEVDFCSDITRMPVAHTCGMVLEIPRGIGNPDMFSDILIKAITWSEGFGII